MAGVCYGYSLASFQSNWTTCQDVKCHRITSSACKIAVWLFHNGQMPWRIPASLSMLQATVVRQSFLFEQLGHSVSCLCRPVDATTLEILKQAGFQLDGDGWHGSSIVALSSNPSSQILLKVQLFCLVSLFGRLWGFIFGHSPYFLHSCTLF